MKRTALAFAAVTALLAPFSAEARAESVTKVETMAAWSLFADVKSPHEFCFVSSEPKSSEPQGASRDTPRVYISAWPKEGIKSEISFRMGFPVKPASEPLVRIGDVQFKLFGANDRIFVKDATQELKLVDAMKKGAELKVDVTSERGTAITDTYSLSGLGKALTMLQDTCR